MLHLILKGFDNQGAKISRSQIETLLINLKVVIGKA